MGMARYKVEMEETTKRAAQCMLSALQSAIGCVDRFVPTQNENCYLVSRRRVEGKKWTVFPDGFDDEAVLKQWVTANAPNHFHFGYAHCSYSECGTIDDVKAYFKDSRCGPKDVVV